MHKVSIPAAAGLMAWAVVVALLGDKATSSPGTVMLAVMAMGIIVLTRVNRGVRPLLVVMTYAVQFAGIVGMILLGWPLVIAPAFVALAAIGTVWYLGRDSVPGDSGLVPPVPTTDDTSRPVASPPADSSRPRP